MIFLPQEALLDEAFVHWGVATADATQDYAHWVTCSESTAPSQLDAVLREWYTQATSLQIVAC